MTGDTAEQTASFRIDDGGPHVVTITGTGVDPVKGDYYIISSWGKPFRVYLADYPGGPYLGPVPGFMDMGVYTYG